MPVTRRPSIWGMYAMLLLGLVLMHHAPDDGQHGGAQHSAPTTVSAGHLTAGHSTVTETLGAETTTLGELPSPHGQQPAHGAADLLHLCVATLAAAVALCVSLLLTMRRRPSDAPRLARLILDHLQPPPPVPRRLAALSVLRL